MLRRIERIGELVEAIVGELTTFREELEAEELVMPHWYSYRLATVLSRVDHAGAEIVISQARQIEADEPAVPSPNPFDLDAMEDGG